MSCVTKTPYAGADGMIPQMKGKFILRNEKSSPLSYSLGNSFPLQSISKCRSKYEAEFTVSVVSFISSSLFWIRCIKTRIF